jgi:hypothetical protein
MSVLRNTDSLITPTVGAIVTCKVCSKQLMTLKISIDFEDYAEASVRSRSLCW